MNTALERAQTLYDLNKPREAAKSCCEMLACEPENGNGHTLLALCLSRLSRPEEALREARLGAYFKSSSTHAHYVVSVTAYEADEEIDAHAAIDEALRLSPAAAYLYAHLSQLYQTRAKAELGLKAAEDGLRLDPQHEGCLCWRAYHLANLGRLHDAQATLDTVLHLNPKSAFAHAIRGRNLLLRRQFSAAETAYRESLRIAPLDSWAEEGLQFAVNRWGLCPAAATSKWHAILLGCVIWLAAVIGIITLQWKGL